MNSDAAIRHKVPYRYDALNWDFIKMLAEIASYAGEKYGAPEQYTTSRLEGDQSPINHIAEHLRQYVCGDRYDRFGGDPRYHLAAIAYNAMMEFWYHTKFGHKLNPLVEAAKPLAKWLPTGEVMYHLGREVVYNLPEPKK